MGKEDLRNKPTKWGGSDLVKSGDVEGLYLFASEPFVLSPVSRA